MTPEAREDLAKLPLPIRARMDDLLARLEDWPNVSGVKYLQGALKGKGRLRTGDFRLQFWVEPRKVKVKKQTRGRGKLKTTEVEEPRHTVIVEKAGHRDGFYDE